MHYAIINHSYVPADFGLGIIVPLIKDKSGDIENVGNYQGITLIITLIPVIFKLFEGVLLSQCEDCLTNDDLQFGFRKGVGCQQALFALKATVDYFISRGSSVYAAALDISKAFDTVEHSKLINALAAAGVPSWITNVINNWYSKLFVVVRWCGSISHQFKIVCGVRQGSMLSPSFFNTFINVLIVALKLNDYGCHVNKCYIGCIFYADDIILISASIMGLQAMLDICDSTISNLKLKFNSSKCYCICFGTRHGKVVAPMKLGSDVILWVNSIKYLGVTVRSGVKMTVDLDVVKRKFYAACNSILSNSIFQSELLRLHLLESYCLPILTYCIAVWDLTKKQISCLNVCWNMMFRKLFGFHKWESVRCCINGLGRLDFEHIYVWLRSKFLKGNLICENSVINNLMCTYRLSKAVAKFCFNHCINFDVPFYALKQQVHAMFQSTCI